MKYNKLILVIASILILYGLYQKISLTIVSPDTEPKTVDTVELVEPTDDTIKKEAIDVLNLLKNSGGSSQEFKKLRDLSIDMGRLIELDGSDTVIKTTEEIRQANKLSGVMLRLDIKGKYKDLAKEAQEVIIASIGDDDVALSNELRNKAIDGFNALAWAYNEAIK